MSGSPSAVPSKPSLRPVSPNFSCGPATKHPGWSIDRLKSALVGRSHRSKEGKERLKRVVDESKALLGLPPDYLLGIISASDTGAIEAVLWSALGPRPVDVFAWESFGKDWVTDCVKQLKPLEARSFVADFGQIPDLTQADPDHDIVFTWNGTSSGVMVPNADWIKDDRKGLTICDATSAVFAMPLPWNKLDVVTYSWQKVLGGEAQHGILILSPRAVERLESHKPSWPVPKIFRMTKDGKLNRAIFEGETINTPSMLCVEDALEAMEWARSIGGLKGLCDRTQANFKVLQDWVARTPWIAFLPDDPAICSPTSVCMKLADPSLVRLSKDEQNAFCKKLTGLLEKEWVGYDINAYRDAPPGLRIWCGGSAEASDIATLTQWIDWAYAVCRTELKAAA
ncbi:MAG: phosphoserine transaminase [Pseudomonadota bacterium]|nr:phosphoserine transaminase [Pseudomonadota bacterium]